MGLVLALPGVPCWGGGWWICCCKCICSIWAASTVFRNACPQHSSFAFVTSREGAKPPLLLLAEVLYCMWADSAVPFNDVDVIHTRTIKGQALESRAPQVTNEVFHACCILSIILLTHVIDCHVIKQCCHCGGGLHQYILMLSWRVLGSFLLTCDRIPSVMGKGDISILAGFWLGQPRCFCLHQRGRPPWP